ncbi:MAG: hypothetical protein JNL92_15775 [Opitutaceae bacterium]|nr:hypothetical protein [Opitutaceae bacterium]
MKTSLSLLIVSVAAGALAAPAFAQGLPPEAHDNIHRLFDQHAAVQRSVTLTATGYTALTESDDPEIARTLRAHVQQMRERLDSGLAVRRWDPAYDEMVRHYKDLDLKVEPTAKGLRVVMTGKTPAAVKIAQNHAQIVSKFVAKGWPEHDVKHPAVAASAPAPAAPKENTATGGAQCGNCGGGKSGGESGSCAGNCGRAAEKQAERK